MHWSSHTVNPLLSPLSQISPPLQSLTSSLPPFNFGGRKVISLRLFQTRPRFSPRPPHYSSLINDRQYKSITTVEIHVDWSGMVYSRVGSSDLLLILGCRTSNSFFFSNLSFFTSPSSFLCRADNTVFASLLKCVFKLIFPPGGGGGGANRNLR